MMFILLLCLGVCQAQNGTLNPSTSPSYVEKIKNLTRRVEFMETRGVYTELVYVLQLEINELEFLAAELRSLLNGSNEKVEALNAEIRNLSILMTQLESHDKNNVLAVRREIGALQKRLNESKSNQSIPAPSQVEHGTSDHGQIISISKPLVVQLNWLGTSYKYGGWGRDSLKGADQSAQWVALLSPSGRRIYGLRLYSSYDNLLIYSNYTDKSITSSTFHGQGAGMIMFNNTIYYNFYNTRDLSKYNLQSNTLERRTLPDAIYTNRYSYSSSAWQDIDLAADEEGLWVIYATETPPGEIKISKLDPNTLSIIKTWHTSQYKRMASNAFMACGVLYATRTLNAKQEEIFYMYDTKTSKEAYMSHKFDKMMENVQSLSYNPNDRKLYMYNDGYLVTYDITFLPP